jgi:hypothetical protein
MTHGADNIKLYLTSRAVTPLASTPLAPLLLTPPFHSRHLRIPHAAGLTLVAPDDGRIRPKHVEPSLFYNKLSYIVASSWFFYCYQSSHCKLTWTLFSVHVWNFVFHMSEELRLRVWNIFWNVTSCSMVEVYRRFGEFCCIRSRVDGDYGCFKIGYWG